MKKAASFLIAFIFLFAFTACGGKREYIVPQYEDNIRIDIGACATPPKPFVTLERYKEVAATGINIIEGTGGTIGVWGYTADDALIALDFAKEAGLKVLVSDYQATMYNKTNWRADFETNFPQYSTHEAYMGNHLCDEPIDEDLPDLKKLYKAYNAVAPQGKEGFMNLFPSAYSMDSDYPEYVRAFMDTVAVENDGRPFRLSYDNYCLMKNYSEGSTYLRDTFFTDMETVRYIAKEYGVPAHNYILSCEHHDYVFPSEAEVRWQVAVNYAYGLTSFSYFTYWQPWRNNVYDVPFERYYNAPVNIDGTKTALYGYITNVNKEVLNWDHVYLRYEWEGTAAINGKNGDLYGLFFDLKYAAYPDGIAGIKNIASDEDVLCGIFRDAGGNKGFMLTNASNPCEKRTASVTVQFDREYKGAQVFEKGKPRVINLDSRGKAVIELEPGEGKFVIPLKIK